MTADLSISSREPSARSWFEEANRNVSGNGNVPFENCDSPFYLARASPSDDNSPVEPATEANRRHHYDQAQATQTSLSRMDSFGSNSADFRSVIDDLTVENQKLRRRVQAYERLYNPHLQKDRLFEVRIHGLLPQDKQKLEETLRDFVYSLESSPNARAAFLEKRSVSPLPIPDHDLKHRLSACTDNSRPVDSAYASMSTSGNASGSQSHRVEFHKPQPAQMSKSQNIRTYLQDIPGVLLPKHPPMMSERSLKKHVVRRLEQLFTGKGASSPNQGQSQQQQEVSQTAARADRSAVEARGQRVEHEGLREAKIMQLDAESSHGFPKLSTASSNDEESIGWTNRSSNATPDQRPTRPLDLDLHRAQVPAENIEYIRHLGVASPKLDGESPQDREEGWVYLNLLIGMAQLHTLNITPEFVRKAVAEVSEKFEISPDGGKLRWRGGTEGTRMSSESYSATSPDDDNMSFDGARPTHATRAVRSSKFGANHRSSFKQDGKSTRSDVGVADSSISHDPIPSKKPLGYEPLFGARTGLAIRDRDVADGASPMNSHCCEDGDQNDQGLSPNPEHGPIIFYNGACFCTDLSGDIRNYPKYPTQNVTREVLGVPNQGYSSSITDQKGTLSHRKTDVKPDDVEMSGTDLSTLPGFTTPPETSGSDVFWEQDYVQLPASGIGGVQPRDNFAIDVEVRHVIDGRTISQRTPCTTPSPQKPRPQRSLIDDCIQKSMRRRRNRKPRVKGDILTTRRTDLQPASLPPPSYVCIPSSSSSSDGEDSDCEASDENPKDFTSQKRSALAIRRVEPYQHPRLRLLLESSQSTKDTTGYESDDDSSSIDMLAHARQVDPDTVAAYEREFDTTINEGPAPRSGGSNLTARSFTDGSDTCSEKSGPSSEGQVVAGRKRERDVDKSLNSCVKRLRVGSERRKE